MRRKRFMEIGVLGLTAAILPNHVKGRASTPASPNITQDQIRQFVAAGHNDLDKVKEMLEEEPNLLYCRYDWGGGDFEEALEGAGHVGNREIAEYLIGQGARVNLFTLAMLGKTTIVIATIEEYPNLLFARGPHGFSLLHHAKVGGEPASELVDYLSEKGLKETKFQM